MKGLLWKASLWVALGFVVPGVAMALSYSVPTYTVPAFPTPGSYTQTTTNKVSSSDCFAPVIDLEKGVSDAKTKGAITALQKFLARQGYMTETPTGYFGTATELAVMRFQARQGIRPSGYVGSITRAAMKDVSCRGVSVTTGAAPAITTISPSTARIGNTVTITGSGFLADNAIYFNGKAAARAASSDSTTLLFVVPPGVATEPTKPGEYQVYVQNANGSSNTVQLKVAAAGTVVSRPTITGVDKPQAVYTGKQGTWVVRINASGLAQTGYNLQLSVRWGDEALTSIGQQTPSPTITRTSLSDATALLTHTYTLPGDYTQSFTITDPAGQSASYTSFVRVY